MLVLLDFKLSSPLLCRIYTLYADVENKGNVKEINFINYKAKAKRKENKHFLIEFKFDIFSISLLEFIRNNALE